MLSTARADGRPQLSPVTYGVDDEGRVVISTYPQRAKSKNVRVDPRVSLVAQSDDWNVHRRPALDQPGLLKVADDIAVVTLLLRLDTAADRLSRAPELRERAQVSIRR